MDLECRSQRVGTGFQNENSQSKVLNDYTVVIESVVGHKSHEERRVSPVGEAIHLGVCPQWVARRTAQKIRR